MRKITPLMGSGFKKFSTAALAVAVVWLTCSAGAQTNRPARNRAGAEDPIARIRDEGLNRSQLMDTLGYLTEVIGPRLTGSPSLKRANEWSRDRLESWGLTNAQLEAWGPFGYGWTLEKFSVDVVAPQYIPVKAFPNAWSPGLPAITGDVVFLDVTNTAQLQKYKGKLKGAIVLASPMRDVPPRFEPLARRFDVTNLLQFANAAPPQTATSPSSSSRERSTSGRRGESNTRAVPAITNAPAVAGVTNFATPPRRRPPSWSRFIPFLNQEGVALILTPSTTGDAGTIFVTGASVPLTETEFANATNSNPSRLRAYATNAPAIPPQMTVAVEDYNRLVRMTQRGEKLKINAELKVKFHKDDLMGYNTVAEIPGSDLKDEIVMLGAHIDSWHSGTGATDNGAGTATVMEAVRIIKALNLQPRRTIRVALWSGEEQGLLGSKAYVAKHFGSFVTNAPASSVRSPRDGSNNASRGRSTRKLVKEDDYDKFSAYFNLDNGAGKIRGVYMQGNEALRPYFRKWLEPFRDLGAETLTPNNTGATDHLSFDNIGLPGLGFMQDPLDYQTRTHHSNEDVLDRIQPEDLKQAAVIMAAFAYQTAMLDEKLPRKPVE